MRNLAWTLGFGLAVSASASGCVSAQSLRSTVQAVTNAQADIVEGINGLDAACQAAQSTPVGLAGCRGPRDRARAGLRRQLDALGSWAKK